ncbi:aldo/keto reductase [Lactiplantibacillus mudanjiangensis]|uniref:2,5-diketo-D-gluconate reductase [Lactobacillus plantarum ZJ316] n=1 Tax=Lactiplantibacillus mudanjiangensis TaxID=1296538 RepID=A0A660DVQ0_9LACO|nr:aldo/keto reductase [Lactiplantibacillus mudanjiangensis]VDG21313.1 2,5-diketo-D-gluconate reductase [Lactobacillus plantarum ZJ316] [Lactiplantibacillus mudanjiangensis]VDG23613.1 2,5-diketo-D-gluconate reductase [Lactobacillus plantarum ZJ316] [Lactiplantibacillus mudanjiangensis]VDG27048.1 2,5-diketo-D-gluconate reductase [Lactobacillus plantarum ZJ316] [Lactiplantibacillus mudanjiangensis]VDG32146.1 2,5-diketo-D-gluconate reductase [Lactobacillus plantarum ZJ316] [Lactiplantibacillus mud
MTQLTKLTDTYELNNGTQIPIVGFGTWQTPDGQVAYDSVLAALKAGYRHIDTAAAYGNEESVGKAIADSGVARKDLFVTTKLWNADHGYDQTKAALATSLEKLGLDYVDLYLIHWPNPAAMRDSWEQLNADTWRAMEELYAERKVRAIGVSNFRPKHLDALLKTAKVIPAVNQIFLNPSDLEPEIVAYNDAHDILSEAYSPLGTGKIFDVPALQTMAQKYDKSVAQVVLRWSLQHGFLPLPKSVHADRIAQNTEIFDFELSADDMTTIDGLRGVAGLANDPDTVNF